VERVGLFLIYGDRAPRGAPANWSAARYEAAVVRIIRTFVRGFDVPRLLEQHLRHFVVVQPYVDWRQGRATTVAMNGFDALPRGQRELIGSDVPNTAWDDTGLNDYIAGSGTGRGTPSYVDYTPSDWLGSNAPIPDDDHAPFYEDAAFVHELVHAVRNSWGVAVTRRFGDDRRLVWHMENTEEFYATVIMNMYNAQRRIPLTTSYQVQTRMQLEPNPRGANHPYLRIERQWIAKFFPDIRTLAAGLAALPREACRYNPFRDFLEGAYDVAPVIRPGTRPYALIGPPTMPTLVDPWATERP
jgi:hypothetical protein